MTLKTVERSLLLPYSPAQMYALVNDVASYPQFLPWCAAARIVEQSVGHMVAALDIRKGLLHLSFTTRNQLEVDRGIRIELVDGSLRSLRGSWSFDDIAGKGVRATLGLEYDFAVLSARLLLEPVFDRVCQSIMNAFALRARLVYGRAGTIS
jgi:ribosome-associated toxin RatA of RatAB toxin-antitoxin module